MDTDDTFLARVAASPVRPPRVDPLGGTRRFELRRRLGAGSFGEVYEARDRESGASVAVKLLKSASPDRLFRFKREFRAVADIAHPNLVRLYELIEEDERWYLTMELVDGLPFAEHVRRAPEQLRACFGQLAQAIETLHRSRCIHRDIKPTNVLVERTGRVVLLDFGLALALDASDQTAIAGTPQYMAPEQMLGAELTPACDWYAFGVMLYQALAGAMPFQEKGELLARAKNQLPAPPSSLRGGIDPELERLCMQLLSPAAGDRPSAGAVLEALSGSEATDDSHASDTEPFAGRAREIAALREVFLSVADTGALALIEGPAGIGKTSLVRAFERLLQGEHAVVFAGRCYEAESVPFKGLDAVVDSLADYVRCRPAVEAARLLPRDAQALSTMFPVLKRAPAFAQLRALPRHASRGPVETRRAAVQALREMIARLSDTAPVTIFVDDLQWGTDDGIHLLTELLAPPTPPALFIVSYRAEAVGRAATLDRFLSWLEGEKDVASRRIVVEALTREEVGELLASQSDGRMSDVEAWTETGGHPFLLTRLLRAAADPALDGHLSGVLDQQFSTLSAHAKSVLELVSLSAAALTHEAACTAAGLGAWDPLVIDELRRAKLIRSLGRSARAIVEPFHDQVRERLVDGLADDRKRALHRQLAEFLEQNRRADADAIAHHYDGAGMRDHAVHWMRIAAAEATESLAFARAAELYGRAAELAADPDERIDLTIDHADAMVLAGRRGDAGRACLAACEPAARAGLGARVAELRARAGEHFMLGGDFHRGTALLREALSGVDVTLPESAPVAMAQTINLGGELAARGLGFRRRDASEIDPSTLRRLDLELTAARSLAQSDIRAPWVSTRALIDALDVGEPQRVQQALSYFAFVNAARLAEHPLGEEVLAMSETLARELRDDAGLAWSVLSRGFICLYRREIERALSLMRESERRFLSLSRPLMREAGISRIGLVTVCGTYGVDLPFALETSKAWIAEALEREDLTPVTWLRLMSTWIDLAADDVDAAQRSMALAREAWSSVEDEIFVAVVLMAELAIGIYADPRSAWDESERLGAVFHKLFASLLPVTRVAFFRHRGSAAVCAYQAGLASKDATRGRLRECVDALASNSNAREVVPMLRAQLAALDGDLATTARLFDEAADGFASRQQRAHSLLARLRSVQASGADTSSVVEELRQAGVVAPDRYGLLFGGPSPVQR